MAAVNQHGELDAAGIGRLKSFERIHRGAASVRPSPEQYVIHQHDGLAGDVERDDGRINIRGEVLVKIIAVHADIQAAERNSVVPNPRQYCAQAPRQNHAAALDADHDNIRAVVVAFGNFVRNAGERALDR